MKKAVFNFLHYNKEFITFIYSLIVLNVIFIILASYKEIEANFLPYFDYFEVFSVVIFTTEFGLRLWVSDLKGKDSEKSIVSRLRFLFSFHGVIDLIAILPFYLPMIFPFDLRSIRILRLSRLLRIFKLGRYSKSMKLINEVLKESRIELSITLFIAFILLVFSSSLMYFVEGEAQPEKFSSIGHAFWWSVATLTTVGYGDVYPITGLGKLLSAFIAIIGIGFIALPTGIISSAFVNKIQFSNNSKKCICPNCQHEFTTE